MASPQPLCVPSPQRGHSQVPHEAAAAEQQVLHSAHEHRGHASSVPLNPGRGWGAGGSRSCSAASRIAAAPPPGLPTPASVDRRGSSLPPNWSFTVRAGLAPAACPEIGRPPTNGCGGHTEAQCPPRPLAGGAERAALSSARRALGAPGSLEARAGEDSPWRSPSALGSGGSGATSLQADESAAFQRTGLARPAHTTHARARTPAPISESALGSTLLYTTGSLLGLCSHDKYLWAATDTGGKKKKILRSIPLDPTRRNSPECFLGCASPRGEDNSLRATVCA